MSDPRIIPCNNEGAELKVGDIVSYENKNWKIIDYMDTGDAKYGYDDSQYSELLLCPIDSDGEQIWVDDYEVF
jgi:hypothetical protein